MTGVKFIFGGARVNPGRGFDDEVAVREAMGILQSYGIDTIDTAREYRDSETILGKASAASSFLLDTKVPGGMKPGSLGRQQLKESLETSLRELQTDKIHTLYFHAPDVSVPIEEAMATADELHKAGMFSHFGLSNYMAEDVEKIYAHCKSHGYVLPTVYQGNYSAVARRQEEVLFPTLRRLGISFYAYSPIAGGFLAKSMQQIVEGSGRFQPGSAYWKLYVCQSFLDALVTWEAIATDAKCSRGELAYRWVAFNSHLKGEFGDGIVIGANGVSQLAQTLQWLGRGPLDESTCARVDKLWGQVKPDAPLDVFNG